MILNLNEQLLRDTKDAHICIFMANLASWLRFNIDKEKPEQRNIHEGRCWSYSTIKDFQNYFDFWSIKNIRTIISHCQQKGLILIGNFNKHKYDKTSWYTFTDKALEYYPVLKERFKALIPLVLENTDLPEVANGNDANGKPIPEEPTTCSNNTITTNSDVEESVTVKPQDVVDAYHEHLPELTKIRVIDRDLRNKINFMKNNWPKYQKDGKEFTIALFVDFLQFIKNHHRWFLKPRTTEGGNIRKNSLRNLIAEINLARFANGEFSNG